MNKVKKSKKYKYIFPCISGLLLCCAFTSAKLSWIAFFAFIPIFYSLLKFNNTRKNIALHMLLFCMFYYVPLLVWLFELIPTIPMEEKQARTSIFFGLFLIGFMFSVYYILSMLFFGSLKKDKICDCFFLASLFTLPEYLIEITPFLPFPWSKTGVIVSNFTPFIQSASLFGNLFISFLVILINSLIAFTIIHFKEKKIAILSSAIAIVIFCANTLYGEIKINNVKPLEKVPAVSIQGNFSGLDKWDRTSLQMFKTYESLTLKNAVSGGIIVWPETAIPLEYNTSPVYQKELSRLSQVLNCVIIVGVFFEENEKEYNSVMAFSPDGTVSAPYYKRMLVPFGEMFPYSQFFKKYMPFLTESINMTTSITQGEKSIALTSSLGKIGGIICYESIFPTLAREAVHKGAEVLVLPSNDSWFGDSPALYQHHCHAVMRAVENNRYLIRASNTGISSIINSNGKVMTFSPTHISTACSGEISMIESNSLYTKLGDIIVIPFAIVYIYGIMFAFLRSKRRNIM